MVMSTQPDPFDLSQNGKMFDRRISLYRGSLLRGEGQIRLRIARSRRTNKKGAEKGRRTKRRKMTSELGRNYVVKTLGNWERRAVCKCKETHMGKRWAAKECTSRRGKTPDSATSQMDGGAGLFRGVGRLIVE